MVQRTGTMGNQRQDTFPVRHSAKRLLAYLTLWIYRRRRTFLLCNLRRGIKITGDYQARFDQAGIMIRIDHKNYIKAGIEFVDGKYNLSTVVTHNTSDWSVITLEKAVPYIWIKAVRRLDAVEIFYSFDDKNYTLMRNAWLQDNTPVQVGLMAACPDGKGFKATFEHFKVKHLPDQRRLEWLRKNAE